VFHSPTAGCAPTIEHPSQQGGMLVGKTVYGPGESGTLSAIFDSDSRNCGRVQIDFGFRRPADPGIAQGDFTGLFFGLVYDYGVDCAVAPPPPPPPPPPTKTTCGPEAFVLRALTVSGRTVTATVRLADGYDHIPIHVTAYASMTRWPVVNGELALTYPQLQLGGGFGVIRAGETFTATVATAEQPWDAWHVVLSCGAGRSQMLGPSNLPAIILRQVFGNNDDGAGQ
jgi:hypothetical protein